MTIQGTKSLFDALSVVLGESLDAQIRAEVEGEGWYHVDLPLDEVFREWVWQNITSPKDPSWMMAPIRSTERKQLCQELGISPNEVIGKAQRDIARLILSAAQLPVQSSEHDCNFVITWGDIIQTIENGEDERAASLARSKAERLLRLLAFFYVSIGYGEELVGVIRNPGSMRVPVKLASVLESEEPEEELCSIILEDGWADLGFLIIFVRKLSKVLENRAERNINGRALELLTVDDQTRFEALARSLQPYAHDKPSAVETRRDEFLLAVRDIARSVSEMQNRRSLPERVLITEVGETFLGASFRAIDANLESRLYHCDSGQGSPSVGDQVLLIAATDTLGSSSRWVCCPWSN